VLKKFIIPTLRRELASNLIAVAVDGSVARNEDTCYSDLELMIFVKDKRTLPHGFSKVHDGLLVEGLFITERDYYKMIQEPSDQWYLAGSDRLLPVVNKKFLQKLKRYRVKNIERKCNALTMETLHEVQEAFGKLLTAIDTRNRENLFVILSDVVHSMLKLLSFINQIPYTSSKKFITEAKKFREKPEGFDDFFDLVTEAAYTDWQLLEKYAVRLFNGVEDYFKAMYANAIYDGDLSTIYRMNRKKKRR
jgi:hypothetical protein